MKNQVKRSLAGMLWNELAAARLLLYTLETLTSQYPDLRTKTMKYVLSLLLQMHKTFWHSFSGQMQFDNIHTLYLQHINSPIITCGFLAKARD